MEDWARRRVAAIMASNIWRVFAIFSVLYWLAGVPLLLMLRYTPNGHWIDHHAVALLPGALGLSGALVGEVASIRASLLKPGHLWPWQARTGTKPLGLGKYLVVVATDLLFGSLAGSSSTVSISD